MQTILLFLIKTYQKIGRYILPCMCRFYPSCSTFAIEAIEKYGVIKGSGKALIRILRCSPFSRGGYDPLG